MLEIIKIIDGRERQKTKTERSKGVAQAIVKIWQLNGLLRV